MPPGSRHWKRLECANCGAVLKFLAKPENYDKRIANMKKLTRLLGYTGEGHGLAKDDLRFLDGLIILGGKFSPKQQARFDRLCVTCLSHKPMGLEGWDV
jgi:hypothetical protein